jgi:hypothetical protein
MQSRRHRLSRLVVLVATLLVCSLSAGFAYNLPYVQDRVGWRVAELRARIKYALFPPEEVVFTPDPTVAAMVQATFAALTPSPTASATPGPSATPAPSATPTLAPTPLPESVQLSGTRHEYQRWNNCGPANLSMALSFWSWQGDQDDTAAILKPNPRDKNVMPYEMANFVEEHTGLHVVVRVGGDLDTLRRFLAAGFSVLIEKGFEGPGFNGWMGHYELLTGYDDGTRQFTAQDSYIRPDLPVPYDQVESYWRHFNDTYLVVYPPERESEVMALLGPAADATWASEHAAQRASDEIYALTGRDVFFAWYNRGTNLVALRDYMGAAGAYDMAFQLYAELDPATRPWRMLWYQTGPYFAYFYSGRYYDVINLATTTLEAMEEPVLEESYYWRALAREALGDIPGAIDDLRTSLVYHTGFAPSLDALDRLGATP